MSKLVILFWHGRGDYLMFSPSLKLLREKYPSWEIILCTGKYNAHLCNNTYDIAVTNPYVNQVIDWLGPQHFDEIQPLLDSADKVIRVEWDVHSFKPRMVEMAGAVGVELRDYNYDIFIPEPVVDQVSRVITQPRDRLKIACSFESGHFSYQWSDVYKFLHYATTRYDVYNLSQFNTNAMPNYWIMRPQDWPVLHYIQWLKSIDIFIGFNAGPMHMAIAANSPLVIGMFMWGDYFCRYMPRKSDLALCNVGGYLGVPQDIINSFQDHLLTRGDVTWEDAINSLDRVAVLNNRTDILEKVRK